MDWQKCMNQALDYIEDNLSGEIDYCAAAKIMNCSEWEFRRIFFLFFNSNSTIRIHSSQTINYGCYRCKNGRKNN